MSHKYQYTGIDRIFTTLSRELGDEWDEGDVIEWAGEALEATGSVKSYEESVIFLEVKNHQANMPKGLHAIIQLAKYDGECHPDALATCAKETLAECDPSFDFAVFSMGSDSISFVPNFNFKLKYTSWNSSAYRRNHFTPIRLATHNFFNTLVCQDSESPYVNNFDFNEYTVINGNVLRFSFQEGCIALAYLSQAVDDDGYPLIPDTYSHIRAIVAYIRFKIEGRKQFDSPAHRKAEIDWHWYCKQAGNIDLMPHGVDEHQNLLEQRSYMLPRQNRYYGFFGNLNKPEIKRYNRR